MMLFDALPVSGGALIGGAVFFVAFVVAAFIVFKLLKKTVKMAFRLTIVAIILLIAVIGSLSFWWLGTSKPAHTEHPRTVQQK